MPNQSLLRMLILSIGLLCGSIAIAGQTSASIDYFPVRASSSLFRQSWSNWEGLGHPCNYPQYTVFGLAVGQNLDGRLEVFITCPEKFVHIFQVAPNDGWDGFVSFGYDIFGGNRKVAQNLNGTLEVFASNANEIFHIRQVSPNSDAWGVWLSLGKPSTQVSITNYFAVGQNQDGRLEVFVQGTDGAIWHNWQTASHIDWSGWSSLGSPNFTSLSRPTVGRNQDGRLEVFAAGNQGFIFHVWQTAPNSGWSGWDALPTSYPYVLLNQPVVAQNLDGRLEVFARGDDDALWHIPQTSINDGWGVWSSLGRPTFPRRIDWSDEPAVGQSKTGQLEVFTSDGWDFSIANIYQTAPNNGWSDWESLAKPNGVSGLYLPAVGREQDGRLELFAMGSDHQLWHIVQAWSIDLPLIIK